MAICKVQNFNHLFMFLATDWEINIETLWFLLFFFSQLKTSKITSFLKIESLFSVKFHQLKKKAEHHIVVHNSLSKLSCILCFFEESPYLVLYISINIDVVYTYTNPLHLVNWRPMWMSKNKLWRFWNSGVDYQINKPKIYPVKYLLVW